MDRRNLAGRCGIYCGACTIYRAHADGGALLHDTSHQLGIPAEEIGCEGCQGPIDQMWGNCQRCELRSCLDSKGLDFCHQCTDFHTDTCQRYQRLSEICSLRGEDIHASEEMFKKCEVDSWLVGQEERWACAACGLPLHWYEERCHHCGAGITPRPSTGPSKVK